MRSSATTPFTVSARHGVADIAAIRASAHKTHKANLFIAFPLPLVVSTSSFVLWKRGCRRVNRRNRPSVARPPLGKQRLCGTHRYSPTLLLSNSAAHLSSRWTKATMCAPPMIVMPQPRRVRHAHSKNFTSPEVVYA